MAQADALQQALARFGASLDSLERFLGQLFEDRDSTAKLKEQVRSLTDERNRLGVLENEIAAAKGSRLSAIGLPPSSTMSAAVPGGSRTQTAKCRAGWKG